MITTSWFKLDTRGNSIWSPINDGINDEIPINPIPKSSEI